MDYTYFLEGLVNKHIYTNEIYDEENKGTILCILCYHVTETSKYPFIQFMMEKIPYCNNLIKEQFIFPFLMFDNNKNTNIQEIVLNKIKQSLKLIGCNADQVTDEMYKGIIFDEPNMANKFAVVNITGIDIQGLNLSRNTLPWFILPSEIINTTESCNICIDEEVVELFTRIPELGVLINPETKRPYILPDAVYTGGEAKTVDFNSVFGNRKTNEYENCGAYFYFYKSFRDAVRDAGWSKQGGSNLIDRTNKENISSPSGKIIVENDYGRYIRGGINRYALFTEGKNYIEPEREFSLTDVEIESSYPEPTIMICYSSVHDIKPDLLVKNYENFVSLSFHTINKSSLDDRYIKANNCNYTIL